MARFRPDYGEGCTLARKNWSAVCLHRPPDCSHVVIGGHIVLLNRMNFQIVDVFHFEL